MENLSLPQLSLLPALIIILEYSQIFTLLVEAYADVLGGQKDDNYVTKKHYSIIVPCPQPMF